MERQQRDGNTIKKGPWTAEEDEILKKYVKKYGPRDWSSIRSMGLLPRTGKSCRLRWVNKLRPNLKSGCRFSAEEERIVIELQGKFGNKWARIATYLPGRTDNDVKNFWSARRKRLARNLPLPPTQSLKNKGTNLLLAHELPSLNVSPSSPTRFEQESSSNIDVQLQPPSILVKSGDIKLLPSPELETNLPIFEAAPIQTIPSCESSSSLCPFSHLPQPQLDISLLPECEDFAPEPIGLNFVDTFLHHEALTSGNGQNISTGKLPPLGLEDNSQMGKNVKIQKPATPDSFLDEFPKDIFDQLESLPSMPEW